MSNKFLKKCIKELENMSQEEFDKMVAEKNLNESDFRYDDFETDLFLEPDLNDIFKMISDLIREQEKNNIEKSKEIGQDLKRFLKGCGGWRK